MADISGTYYKPGSLGIAESLPFAISTDVYEYENIRLEDGAGAGVDLGTEGVGSCLCRRWCGDRARSTVIGAESMTVLASAR